MARTHRLRPQAPHQRAAGGRRPQGHRVRRDLPELPDLTTTTRSCRSPSPAERDQRLIRLEHGEPVRFGPDGKQGLRFGRFGGLEAVPAEGTDPDSLLVHNAHEPDPSYAFALSRLDSSDFAHTPIGVFRAWSGRATTS